MRIRNSSYLPPPPSSLSPRSPKRLHCSDDQITFDRSPESTPHVMISRINGLINSTSRVFVNQQEQNQGISHDEEEEEEEEMNFTPDNQSLEGGGWREEEKAMPLKKRRKVSSSEVRREGDDRGKMVKVDEDLMRCGRTDGRRWRCSGRRVEGYSMCEHHLMTRSARYRSENLKREIDEEGDEKGEDEGCLGKFAIGDGNTNNKRKGARARSINSLLRDTV